MFSPVPHWNEILLLDDHGRSHDDAYDLTAFTATVSALFVGVGQALRDELARVRYIGPVRDIHPQTRIASSARHRAIEAFAADFIYDRATFGPQSSHPASWADGSAAWTYLHTNPLRDMIEEVSDWLARENRLDTGYALRVRSRVTIYEDETQLVSEMREYHLLQKTYGNAEGSVDLAGWSRAKAEAIVDEADPHYRQAALEHCDRLRAMFARAADGTSISESMDDLDRDVFQAALDKFGVSESIDIKPGIRREAERNRRLAEDWCRLLALSAQDIKLQIAGSGEDLVGSSETLKPAYCRRLNALLPKWESDAPRRIHLTGIVDGLRAMPHRDDLLEEVETWTDRREDARSRNDVSFEVVRLLSEFRKAVQATVASASRSRNMDGSEGRRSQPERCLFRGRAIALRVPQGGPGNRSVRKSQVSPSGHARRQNGGRELPVAGTRRTRRRDRGAPVTARDRAHHDEERATCPGGRRGRRHLAGAPGGGRRSGSPTPRHHRH